MKKKTYQDDKTWKEIAPHLTGQCRQHGGMAKDNRKLINAVVLILRTVTLWRDLPPDCGSCLSYNQGDLRFF